MTPAGDGASGRSPPGGRWRRKKEKEKQGYLKYELEAEGTGWGWSLWWDSLYASTAVTQGAV